MSDKFAHAMTFFFKFTADLFFAKRYGHRAVVLETVAAVPGMVAGMWSHFESLRKLDRGHGTKIHRMLAEAENERKHLIFFLHIAQPSLLERFIIVIAQIVFTIFYLFMYIFFRGTAHRMVGCFEDEAVKSYTNYLAQIENKQIENVPAPQVAIEYYNLAKDAKLRELVLCVREDERKHAYVNHKYADSILRK